MQKQTQIELKGPSPTLHTILMVEHTLQTMKGSVMTVPELKQALPKQVNHNTLKQILEYLEQSNKIFYSFKGITWIHTPNARLQQALVKGREL